jgi:hypothetical protein
LLWEKDNILAFLATKISEFNGNDGWGRIIDLRGTNCWHIIKMVLNEAMLTMGPWIVFYDAELIHLDQNRESGQLIDG